MGKIVKIEPDSLIEIGDYHLPPKRGEKAVIYHQAHISGMSYSVNPQTQAVDRVALAVTRRVEIKKRPFWKRLKYLFDNKPILIDETITFLGDVIKTIKRK